MTRVAGATDAQAASVIGRVWRENVIACWAFASSLLAFESRGALGFGANISLHVNPIPAAWTRF